MRVNLHILAHDLSSFSLQGTLRSDPWDRTIAFATTHAPTGAFRSDRLYVLEAATLDGLKSCSAPHASIICIGKPPASALAATPIADLLWTEESLSASRIAEEANAVIAAYSKWSDDLSELFAVNKPLRKVAERTEPIFDDPLWMWDAQFQTVFHVASEERYALPPDYKMHFDGTPWPISEVNAVNSTFREALAAREPHILPAMFGYESLCYNLFDNDAYIATLAVDNVTGKPFTIRDRILIKLFGDKLIHALKYEAHFSKHATYLMNEYLERLLSGEAIPRTDLSDALAKMGWSIDDSFFCIMAHQTQNTSYPDVFLIPAAESICDAFPHTVFSIHDGSILFVTDLTLSALTPYDLCGPLAERLSRSKLDMKIGVSTPFSDFAQVRFFYDQAHEAIHLGEERDPDQAITFFHDCILDSVIHKCVSGTVPETLFHPAISRLMRYDKANDGDLLRTLRTFLEQGMSMKKTSEALFMHRNTLLSRLKTIEEVGGITLDDHGTRLQCEIAFLLTKDMG